MSDILDDHESLSAETLAEASKAQLVDQNGKEYTLGELTKGKKVVLIFIRHYWCGNCQAYVAKLGRSIPPSNLPPGTSILIIGCGDSKPLKAYLEVVESPYEIYGNPSMSLYKLFGFKYNGKLPTELPGYLQELGGFNARLWESLKNGPFRNIQHLNSRGPMKQNGGELVLEEDGSCSFFHRMETTADHIELPELAKVIGAEYIPSDDQKGLANGKEMPTSCETGVTV